MLDPDYPACLNYWHFLDVTYVLQLDHGCYYVGKTVNFQLAGNNCGRRNLPFNETLQRMELSAEHTLELNRYLRGKAAALMACLAQVQLRVPPRKAAVLIVAYAQLM